MKKLLYLIFLFLTVGIFAQNTGQTFIDSLLTVLPDTKENKNRANILNALSKAYWRISDYSTAERYANDALRLSKKIKYRNGEAEAYKNIGDVNDFYGNYSQALENYFVSIEIFKEIGDKVGVENTYNNIGIIYWQKGNYPEAIKNYFNALKVRQEIGDKAGIINSNISIGSIYMEQR